MGNLFDMPGFGGVVACAVITILMICYAMAIRWITKGHKEKSE